jgi:hypothetical protein
MSAIDKSEFDLPGINWLAHVLSENVGRTEWVKMNPEEQSEFTKFTGSDYQFKVVKQPIPDSPNVIELDDGKYIAAFNTERAKNLYIQLAQLYIKMEQCRCPFLPYYQSSFAVYRDERYCKGLLQM